MQKKDKNLIRFDRKWNPKRIAMIFMVQALRDYLKNPELIEEININNYMTKLKELEPCAQKEALAWIIDDAAEDAPFSFNWVCGTLDIFPHKIRKQILSGEISFEDVEHTQIAFVD